MKKMLTIFIICSLCLLLCIIIVTRHKVVEENCACSVMVECYYPGYKPGVDLPFASKIVYSGAEANEYMEYMSSQEIKYPDDWIEVPKYSSPVFFYLYPAS